MRGGRGTTLLEVLIALVMGLLVTQLALSVLARQRSVQARLSERADVLAALRVGRHVLGTEVRRGVTDRDWSLAGDEVLELRAFRGVARICPPAAPSPDLLVAYDGIRGPDPDKDSLLLLGPDGVWTSVVLLSATPTSLRCSLAPDEPVQAWTVGSDVAPGTVLARLFERGSYHLSGSALRYLRGQAGRQPLTPEVLATPPSGFILQGGKLFMELVPLSPEGNAEKPWRGLLTGHPDL